MTAADLVAREMARGGRLLLLPRAGWAVLRNRGYQLAVVPAATVRTLVNDGYLKDVGFHHDCVVYAGMPGAETQMRAALERVAA